MSLPLLDRLLRAVETPRQGGPHARRRRHFSVAASYFTHVNLVGIVNTDFTVKDEAIFRRPRRYAGPGTRGRENIFWAGKQREHE